MGKTVKNEDKRDYKFSIKLYPDCKEYNYIECIRKLKEYFEFYAYITHDKDTRKFARVYLRKIENVRGMSGAFQPCERKFQRFVKPHIHFYGRNNVHCKIAVRQIIQYLEIPYHYATRPNEFTTATDWLACLFYTVHRNAPDKYQYPVTDVITNIPNFEKKLRDPDSFKDDLKILYEVLEQYSEKGQELPYYELVRILAVRNCSPAFIRSPMAKQVSESYQYYKIGRSPV